ncbi:MAG: hypothetical protein ABR563_14410 [Pyrinomonadaceae bacterium]
MDETNQELISTETRMRLGEVRHALLKLHKALLDDARVGFERARGRIESSGEFLQLVLDDEWFAYLRPLSALVVQIDELLDAEEATTREADALLAQARAVLRPDEGGSERFGEKYRAALQRSPDVILAHGEVAKLFGGSK